MKRHGVLLSIVMTMLIYGGFAYAESPEITNGLNYLTSTQDAAGFWNGTSLATDPVTATAEAVEALRALERTGEAGYTSALGWLGAQELETTGYLSQRVFALSSPETDMDEILTYLDELTGAWGGYEGYDINVLDTALALRALKAAEYSDWNTTSNALEYLTEAQNPDGGWGFCRGNESNTYITSLVAMTLQGYAVGTSVATSVSKATNYLIAHQNLDGGFGSSPSTAYETALSYLVLSGLTTDETVLGTAVNYLKGAQVANGSWNDDPYSTALALRALDFAEAYPPTPEDPGMGTITPPLMTQPGTITGNPTGAVSSTLTGKVTDAATGTPISGAFLSVAGTDLETSTSQDGTYELLGIEILEFNVNVSAEGYNSRAYSVSTTGFGEYAFEASLVKETFTTVTGFVTDAETGEPIAGADVLIVGTGTAAKTSSDGSYTLAGIDLLEFSLRAFGTGYNSRTYNVQTDFHGDYLADFELKQSTISSLRITSIDTDKQEYSASEGVFITATIENRGAVEYTGIVHAEIKDGEGNVLANVAPRVALLNFEPAGSIQTNLEWNTGQFPPGDYSVALKIIASGTVTADNPSGFILAMDAANMAIAPKAVLGGAISLDPPATHQDFQTPVKVNAMVRNNGNVPITSALILEVTADGIVIYTAQSALSDLSINNVQEFDYGSFVPQEGGKFQVELRPAEQGISSDISAALYVGEHARAEFTVEPVEALAGNAKVRAVMHLSGTTAEGTSIDPLVPLMKEAIQKGVDFEQREVIAWHYKNECNGCHVQSQGLVALEKSRDVVTVEPYYSRVLFEAYKNWQLEDGSFRKDTYNYGTAVNTNLGLWAISAWHDYDEAKPYIIKATDWLVNKQRYNGYWTCDSIYPQDPWWQFQDNFTSLAMMGISHAYNLSGDPKYLTALEKAAWYISRSTKTTSRMNILRAMKVMGLASALEFIQNETIRARTVQAINSNIQTLLSNQLADGGWGPTDDAVESDSLVTAMVLYALLKADVAADDPTIRQTIEFLLDNQSPDGSWHSQHGLFTTNYSVTTWVTISLPLAFERTTGIFAEINIGFPEDIQVEAANPSPSRQEGAQYVWKLEGISETGKDIALNLTLQSLAIGESRSVAESAIISFENPDTGDTVTIPVAIPSVTGIAPISLDVVTNEADYQANEDVMITATLRNINSVKRNASVRIEIKDITGGEIAQVALVNVDSLDPSGLPGWAYRIPVTITAENVLRNAPSLLAVNFEEALESLGISGKTVDQNSVRVLEVDAAGYILGEKQAKADFRNENSADITWLVDGLTNRDESRYFYIYFDITENGIKPTPTNTSVPDTDRLLATTDNIGNLYVARIYKDGTFGPLEFIEDITTITDQTRGVMADDYNNDGYIDIVTGSGEHWGGALYFYRNKADGSNTFYQKVEIKNSILNAANVIMDMAGGDFNNDGNRDFVVSGDSVGLIIFLGRGDGTFSRKQFYWPWWWVQRLRGKSAVDVDSDGNMDLIIADSYGRIYIMKGNGDGTFSVVRHLSHDYYWEPYGVAAGDFDCDNIVDIIFNRYDAWNKKYGVPYFRKGKADGTYEAPLYIPSLDTGRYTSYDVADINLDGKLDIIASGGRFVELYPGNGDGTFDQPLLIGMTATGNLGIGISHDLPKLNHQLGAPEEVPSKVLHVVWNTGKVYPDNYTVHAVLLEESETITFDDAPFKILPDVVIGSKVVTDRISYNPNESVTITSTVTNMSENFALEDLIAKVSIRDVSQTVIFSQTETIPVLFQNETKELKTYWSTSTHPEGMYAVTLDVMNSPTVLTSFSAEFSILGSGATGKGLVGDIKAQPALVKKGNDETLLYTIENRGNGDISDLGVSVLVVNPVTKAVTHRFEAPADIPRGTTAVNSFVASTSELSAGVYLAILEVSTASMPEPKTLASTRFEVEAPAIEFTKTFGGYQNVLVWLNYPWQSGKDCPDVSLIESALKASGVAYHIVYDKKDFQAEMRNPIYSDFVILGDHHPLEDHYAASLREKVFSGKGLISSMFNRQNLDERVFGMKFTGHLSHGDYSVRLGESEISPEKSFQSTGTSLRVEAIDASESIGWIVRTTKKGMEEYPGIMKRSYGLGNVLFFAFDLGLSTSSYDDFESLLVNSLGYIHKEREYPGYFHPHEFVPVEIKIESLGDAMEIRLDETYPEGFVIYDPVTGQWVEDNPWTVNISLGANEVRSVSYYALTPDVTGTFTLMSIAGYIENGSYGFLLSVGMDVAVKSKSNILTNVLGEISAVSVSWDEESLITDALMYLQNVRNRTVATKEDMNENIVDILQAIDSLLEVTSADISDIILRLDGLLEAWEGTVTYVL